MQDSRNLDDLGKLKVNYVEIILPPTHLEGLFPPYRMSHLESILSLQQSTYTNFYSHSSKIQVNFQIMEIYVRQPNSMAIMYLLEVVDFSRWDFSMRRMSCR